jgi:hypothetical protein
MSKVNPRKPQRTEVVDGTVFITESRGARVKGVKGNSKYRRRALKPLAAYPAAFHAALGMGFMAIACADEKGARTKKRQWGEFLVVLRHSETIEGRELAKEVAKWRFVTRVEGGIEGWWLVVRREVARVGVEEVVSELVVGEEQILR